MADMRISELTTAAGLHDGDLFETSQTDSISSSGYASYKTSLNAIAAFIAKQVQFSGDLQTTSKTLIGAINEVFNAGTSVTVTNVLPATETTKRVATITVDGVAKDINADDTVKVITDLKTPKSATITNGIAQFDCIEENLVKGLKVTMNPIQDLHGYSNPWAGGAGKNKLIYPYKSGTKTDHDVTFTVNSDGTVDLSGTSSGYAEFVFQSRLDGTLTLPAGSYILSGGINYDIYLSVANSSGTNLGYDRGSGLTFTLDTEQAISVWIGIAGSVNTNGKKIEPMLRLSTVTDVTFAPYENICPISGRTEASVTRTGKNVFGGQAMIDNAIATKGSASRPPIDDANNTIAINGAQDNERTLMTFGNWVKSNTQYTFIFTYSKNQDSRASNMRIVYTDGNYINIPNLDSSVPYGTKGSVKVTTSAEKTISYLQGVNMATTATLYCDESGIFEGSVEIADFTPYTAETHTHQYGQTVYGGEDDFVNGGTTVTLNAVDMGDLTYTSGSGYVQVSKDNIQSVTGKDMKRTNNAFEISSIWDVYQTVNSVRFATNLTPEEFALLVDGQTLCYELATPDTISTSAEEITTVASTNIISGTEPISECKYTELATVDDLIKIIGGQ